MVSIPQKNNRTETTLRPSVDSMTFILFGATGDLAKRKIFSALLNIYLEEKMPPSFSIIGVGLEPWSTEEFQAYVLDTVRQFSRKRSSDAVKLTHFIQSFHYLSFDVKHPASYHTLRELIEKQEQERHISPNRLFYLSVAPELVEVITTNIRTVSLGSDKGWKRLIIEKPFGYDLHSAQALYQKLNRTFAEDEMFIIDHYLGKSMVQNIETLAFANPILQTLWNKNYIANVQITASETVGVENRAGYYDRSGAIRDMVQNHMLQLLMMTGMKRPHRIQHPTINHSKTKILENLRPVIDGGIQNDIVRGQYTAGTVNDKEVVGYKDEPGISSSSHNDTFFAARLWIDDEFWEGVPFYIRTGKRMKTKSTRIVMEFKNPLEPQQESSIPNLLEMTISPHERVSFQLNSKNPLNNGTIEPVCVHFTVSEQDIPEAYETLLFNALRGDTTYFVNWKEIELSWKWIQPILQAFAQNEVPLHEYEAGTMGPAAADRLLEKDGFKWW